MRARPEPERARDLLPHAGRGASGERHGLGLAQPIAGPRQLPVAGPEIVAPLGNAVRLVHHQQPGRMPCRRELLAQALEPLGRDVQQPERAVGDGLRRTSACSAVPRLLLRQAAGSPRARAASTWSCISEIRGETTMLSPRQHQRGNLEADGLAAAGGQHRERVPALEDGLQNDRDLRRGGNRGIRSGAAGDGVLRPCDRS